MTIELVPETSWYNNLRKHINTKTWDKIRKKTYSRYDYTCGICGKQGRLNCHEIWKYDEDNNVQKLEGFIALCNMCHLVKHIGYAQNLAAQGKINYNDLIEHFIKINECDKDTFNKHKERAYKEWRNRSTINWNVNFGKYEIFIEKKE